MSNFSAELNHETHGHFRTNGWVVVENVFDLNDVQRIAQVASTVADDLVGTSTMSTDHTDDGELIPRKIPRAFTRHEAFRKFVLDPTLTKILESLLGAPPLLLTDQVFMKPPRHGSAKPYHQDNAYFRIHPADQAITAWIALDDVDVANGCLRYISGSHQDGILPHQQLDKMYDLSPPTELIDMSREALAPVRAGGVVFHHCQTLHTSHRNTSDRWRRGYATHWITNGVTSENDTLDTAYFRDPEFAPLFAHERD